MTRLEYIEYIKFDNKSGKKTKESWLKKHHPDVHNNIINYCVGLNVPFNQKVYHYVNQISELPKCIECGNDVKFNYKNGAGYNEYCSIKCANSSKKKIQLTKNVCLEKYGSDCSLQNPEVIKKTKESKKFKYGNENYNNLDKIKETKLKKYGDEFYLNHEKSKQTKLEKYGNENYFNNDLGRETKLERYGDENYNNRNKAKQTKLERYGDENYTNRDKAIETNLKKYGVESFSKTNEFKLLIKESHNQNTIDKWIKVLNINKVDFIINDGFFTIKNFCNKHNRFDIDVKNFYNRQINSIPLCTKCHPINGSSSIIEDEFVNEIKKIYNGNIIRNDREILDGYEIDIYIPEFKLGIEINGLYWHSNKFKNKNYHAIKTDIAINKNIELIQLFDDELIHNKELILSFIKNKLNLNNNKIFARKCNIGFVTPKESMNFLNENHIQGSCKSKYKVGLYFDNELVSLMTFSKSRKSISLTDNSFSLDRFCNKRGFTIVGSASKLLKNFIRNYNPSEIITFADRRYSMGKIYDILGFNKIKDVDASYYVFNKKEYIRYHRFNYNKQNLIKMGFDSKKSESEILEDNGFLKIYDCGKIKYQLICQ